MRVYLEVAEDGQAERIEALLGALGYEVLRTFKRQRRRIEAQFEALARGLSADERETLHAMLVTDDHHAHARLVGVEARRAEVREERVLFKLHAANRLALLRRLAGVKAHG